MNKRFNEDLISPEAQELLILASLIPVVITVVLSYSAGKLLLYNCTLSFWLMLKASTQSPKSFPIQSELTAVQSFWHAQLHQAHSQCIPNKSDGPLPCDGLQERGFGDKSIYMIEYKKNPGNKTSLLGTDIHIKWMKSNLKFHLILRCIFTTFCSVMISSWLLLSDVSLMDSPHIQQWCLPNGQSSYSSTKTYYSTPFSSLLSCTMLH